MPPLKKTTETRRHGERKSKLIPLYLFLFLCTLFAKFPPALANEDLRINGMGGAFVGLYGTEGAIFGNPAGLINVEGNNLSIALSAQNLDYETLPLQEGEQTNTQLSFRLTPSIYYSRVIRGVGIGVGYVADLDNRNSTFRIENTEAEYIIDERKFVSETDTILEYDLFREKRPVFSVGWAINPKTAIGIRMKYRHRIVKEGTIHRPVNLTSVHGEDVNRNDATKLLPAIIDNLDIGDAVDRFKEGEDGHEEVVADLSGGGIDFDLGIQTKLPIPGNLSAGFMLDHLIQTRVISPQPSRITIGVGAKPREWVTAAFDIQKALDKSGLDLSLGWEICHRWERWFSGGIMIRNGFAHSSSEAISSSSETKNRLSVGIGMILGESHWDYTLVKPLDGSPISKSVHMFSSSTRF